MLPEEILLEIFDFYVFRSYSNWQTLVHVCRRWRSIVFAAPRRLNLRLLCTGRTPARETLDIWPALPIVIRVVMGDEVTNDVLAALQRHDRICEVHIDNVSDGELRDLVGAMQVIFPILAHLDIHAIDDEAFFPESLLGGSAPNLQSLHLDYTAFPTLPKLLLSCPALFRLSLLDISYPGPSANAMVDCLSSLTRLKHLQIECLFSHHRSDRARQRPPPRARTVFPVLSTLILKGVTEHVDQLLAHIEAPNLDDVRIRFLDPPIFDISRLSPCIGPTETFENFDEAYTYFGSFDVEVVLSSQKGTADTKVLTLSLRWKDSVWKLEGLSRYSPHCSFQPFYLYNLKEHLPTRWANVIWNDLPWLHLLRFFTATEYLYLSRGLAVRVAPALRGLTGAGVTDVLPVVRNIFVERLDSLGAVQEAIGEFVAARQLLSGHPIDVQSWRRQEVINRHRSGRR
jgi:hypothetical protein